VHFQVGAVLGQHSRIASIQRQRRQRGRAGSAFFRHEMAFQQITKASEVTMRLPGCHSSLGGASRADVDFNSLRVWILVQANTLPANCSLLIKRPGRAIRFSSPVVGGQLQWLHVRMKPVIQSSTSFTAMLLTIATPHPKKKKLRRNKV